MTQQPSEIRIYVACLAAYNNGILYGRWIDAEQEAKDIWAEIAMMLKASPIPQAEEWAIHDYEGFEGAPIAEYQSIESVAEIASFISDHGALGGQLNGHFNNLDEARRAIDDQYAGKYTSLADFAEELTAETIEIPESLRYYIDYEAMARDMAINDIFTIETGFEAVHVFWSR